MFSGSLLAEGSEKDRLFLLLKLLRVPRLFELLNVTRIKQSITSYYNNKLKESIKKNVETENYPILKAFMFVQIYKIFRLVIIIFTSSYFLGILWHIFVTDILVTEFDEFGEPTSENFYTVFFYPSEKSENPHS